MYIYVYIYIYIYIFFDELLLFRSSFECGKHGGLQQIVARLMYTTPGVSFTQGYGNQIISLLSLTCLHKYHFVCYGCFHRNL